MKIAAPKRFLFGAVSAGIRKPGRKDVAVIFSELPCAAAAVFTTNQVKAAPVRLGMKVARRGAARAVVVNSGNANACTGPQGLEDARMTASVAGSALGLPANQVFVCSTGVIGEPLPMDRLVPGVLDAAVKLDANAEDVAQAIMTTDLFPKLVSRRFRVEGKTVTVTGLAKGAGMIAPNMATMLGFILTDAGIAPKALDALFRTAVNQSFNRITVDGDRSTNDTALVMANGASGVVLKRGTDSLRLFGKALSEVAYDLSRLIVKDGEGASKLVEVLVTGASREQDADRVARTVANSLLVKTAVYGQDANWGRIVCAAGYSGVVVREGRMELRINGVPVVSGGLPTGKDKEASRRMRGSEVKVHLELGLGKATARVLTCDLTEKYIEINAEYRT